MRFETRYLVSYDLGELASSSHLINRVRWGEAPDEPAFL